MTLLRAHERGTGFGPDNDHIDVESVGQISSEPQHFFGLRLRTDDTLPSREAMFALLRDGLARTNCGPPSSTTWTPTRVGTTAF